MDFRAYLSDWFYSELQMEPTKRKKRTAGTMLLRQSSCKWIFAWCHFFNVMQPTEARFCASEILAYTSVVVTFL